MTRTALVYGIISGTIVILSMLLGIVTSGGQGFWASELFGYLIMLIALSMIFVGIKRHRDQELGGVIRFLPALGLGLAISAIAAFMYVFVWEMYLLSSDYAFIHEYAAGVIENARARGVTGEALGKVIADTQQLTENYGKPWYRLPITFLEIFPVGLLISLVSAALLRNPKILPARS
ncbi:Protein of unknown function [Parasphingorhabdus marina DSM 22363]|uniref:DUF4199 domain-containing protein n=1 Tax=Parasphingorhabdus marina DSM 22363 TaxID=1123272 RepID=A0A1N6DB35_9SPHN|nr:DUF4199 domain-containing protein [Parasphingorhabdus marina]SIN68001.1 Protein of unknown function [Parasphingorhabdus marina DSM 22363]